MSHSLVAVSLCLLSVLPIVGRAQDPARPGVPRATEFPALHDSQWVRFTSTGVSRQQGRILEHDGPELVVSTDRQPLRIHATSIDTLWTRGNSANRVPSSGASRGHWLDWRWDCFGEKARWIMTSRPGRQHYSRAGSERQAAV